MTGTGALIYIGLKLGIFGLLTWMWLQARRAAKEIEARKAERAQQAQLNAALTPEEWKDAA
ncbi:MAG: hypothetical protein AAF661_01135 [Pseudomonadota bacterium]